MAELSIVVNLVVIHIVQLLDCFRAMQTWWLCRRVRHLRSRPRLPCLNGVPNTSIAMRALPTRKTSILHSFPQQAAVSPAQRSPFLFPVLTPILQCLLS